jgi:predicted amidohydrolase
MKSVRVALAQIEPTLGEPEANLELHLATVERAREEGAAVLVFPELSLTGYLLMDQVPDVAVGEDDAVFARLARASREIDLVVGLVEEAPGHRFYNAAAYFSGGCLVHLHRKLYLPTYGPFLEARDFSAGEKLRRFDAPYAPCGMLICEDLWHSTSAWLLAQEGAEIIYVLSNGPTRGARPGRGITSLGVWRQLLQVTAQLQTVFMVLVNRTGCEDGLSFGGGSMVVDPFGRVVAELPPLEAGLVTLELDAELLRRARTAYPLLREENLELVRREMGRIRRLRYDLQEEEEPAERSDEGPARRAAGTSPKRMPR